MCKFFMILGLNIVGSIGWWIGGYFGMWTGFILGSLGSALGVCVGWKIYDEYIDS